MLVNQIKLVNIVIHILERLMKGMTMDFAVTRIFELEAKRDVPFNRKMIGNYLNSLTKGLERNKNDYLNQNNLTEEQLRLEYAEKRFTEGANNKELRKFEVKGYEQMLSRIIDAPLASSKQNENSELQGKLMMIKDQLAKQAGADLRPLKQKAITTGVDFFENQMKHLSNLEKDLEKSGSGSEEESGESEYDSEESGEEDKQDEEEMPDDEKDLANMGNGEWREIKPLNAAQEAVIGQVFNGSFMEDMRKLREMRMIEDMRKLRNNRER